ncbi:MAG: hypothetical protein LEGION0403_FIIPPAGN_01430 [Legionella sp.]|uniref:hypothetical protein n=1 Tax=Legionella sp. TaxID=459 RepID=UPI003D114074
MAKNEYLWQVLHNLEWSSLDETDKDNFVKACDALLAVDSSDSDEFRKVAKEHAEILGLLDDEAAKKWATPSRFNPLTYDSNDYYTKPDFLDANDDVTFRNIQQEAAAQRVKLGLSEVANQSVLLDVMQNNKEALREYIAQHIAPSIAVGAGWNLQKPSEDNILTDEILEEIQKNAVARWVLMVVETADLEVLNRLNDTHGDAFDDAINDLPGFPQEAGDLNLIGGEQIWDLVKERVLARQKELSVQVAFSEYAQYIEDLSGPEVLSKGGLLTADDVDFRTNLPDAGVAHSAHKEDLSDENVKALREQLGERYLRLDVARRLKNGESLDQLFMADTKEAFEAELKKLYPAHTYIDPAVSSKFFTEYKAQMAPHMIANIAQKVNPSKDYMWLLQVASQSDAAAKNAIKASITIDDNYLRAHFPDKNLTKAEEKEEAIQQAKQQVSDIVDALFTAENRVQLDEIRQKARMAAFEIVITNVTNLPSGAHKALFDAFSKMSVAAQEKLMPADGNDAVRMQNLRYLANARDLGVLKHYMPGAAENDLQAVLAFSEQIDVVKKIQNPGICKALGGRFPIALNAEQVKLINETLAGKDWSQYASYIQMVAEIRVVCGVSEENKAAFYEAFGLAADGAFVLTADGKNIKDPDGFITEIYNHNKKYQKLFDEYQSTDSTINKDFLGAMLALPLVKGTIPNTPSKFKVFQDTVLNIADRNEFIGVCFTSFGNNRLSEKGKSEFKASLERAITPAVFHNMQAELLKQASTKYSPEDANKAVRGVEKILVQMQQSQEKIDKHLNSAKFVFDVKEIHVNNLLIREQEKASKPGERIREKYGALAKDCDANMNELRHEHARLQSLINALPRTADDIVVSKTKDKVGPQIETLKAKLQAQLDKIDQQLMQYAQIKECINGPEGILVKADRVKQQPYWYYNRADITSGVVTREELKARSIQSAEANPDDDMVVADAHDPGKVANFNLADKLASTEVRYFDIVQKRPHTSDSSKMVTIESRFTYDTSKSVPTTATDRGIHRMNAGRIAVDKFPDYQAGSEKDPVLLEKAKVDYAMVVATQLLATMDRPPSKDSPIRLRGKNEEQLKYIWTALVVLGEKTPNMKFGPEAIRVVNEHIFNPKAQLGWGWSNFSKDSLYEKVFKKHSAGVTTAIEASKEQASERLDRKGTPKSEEQMKETSQLYRSTINTNREQSVPQPVAAETKAEQDRRLEP